MFPLLHDTYRFILEVTATETDNGFYNLTPTNQRLEWRWSNENDLGVWAMELATKLTFRNNSNKNIYDFDILKAEFMSNTPCLQRDFVIQRRCGNGSFENYHYCQFRINKCVWDFDGCEVECEVYNQHPLWCILDEKRGSNLLNAEGNVYLKRFGRLERQKCYYDVVYEYNPGDPFISEASLTPDEFLTLPPAYQDVLNGITIDPNDKWTEIKTNYLVTAIRSGENGGQITVDIYGYRIETYWYRVFSSVEPPDVDKWTVVTGGWARPPDTEDTLAFDFQTNSPNWFRQRPLYEAGTFLVYRRTPPENWGYPNGRYLEEIFDMFIGFTNCQGMQIKSNFFKINPVGDDPDNEAYALADYLFTTWKLAFWQISDVSFPLVYETGDVIVTGDAATISRITFLQFLTDLKKVFNLGFGFDTDTQTIIIEHISFFKLLRRIDLTSSQLIKYIRGGHKFSFDTENLPNVEKFGWSQDFSQTFGMKIEYFGACTAESNNELNLYTERLYTDLRYISQRHEEFTDSDAIFMALINEDGYLVEQNDNIRVNDYLSYPNLLTFHMWERPLIQGYVDENYTTFITSKKLRKQIPLSVPICCDDVKNFKPDILVKSQMGWCEIDEVSVFDPAPELKVTLKQN